METKVDIRIGVIGLGYVGLPLAILFSERYKTVGYDTDIRKIEQLHQCYDKMGEISSEQLKSSFESGFDCSTDSQILKSCNIYIK